MSAQEWLIQKDGYFYRPNKHGYTTSKLEAGRYTKEDAALEAAIEPWHMRAIHESDVPDPPLAPGLRVVSVGKRVAEEDAFEAVAQWHDKNARLCLEASRDDPRMSADDRRRAHEAHKHHAASAAAIRAKQIVASKRSIVEELVATTIIAQIEERFPNWRSYRDLLDCIDCTLSDLRRGR